MLGVDCHAVHLCPPGRCRRTGASTFHTALYSMQPSRAYGPIPTAALRYMCSCKRHHVLTYPLTKPLGAAASASASAAATPSAGPLRPACGSVGSASCPACPA